MDEHLNTNGVVFQMLMMLKQVASIFFFFFFFLPENNLPATEITFSILCDASPFVHFISSSWFRMKLHHHLLLNPGTDLLTQYFGSFPGFRLIFHLAELFRRHFGVITEYPRQGTHRA